MDSDSEATVSTFKPLPFVEVNVADGIRRRFAAGTKAGFAIDRINRSEAAGVSTQYSFITAVKEGEEAVEFGPDAELVSYGKGWKLQAVQDVIVVKSSQIASSSYVAGGSKVEARDEMKAISQPVRKEFNPADFYPGGKLPEYSEPKDGWAYLWNMSCVLGLIVLGCVFWIYLLENQFFLSIN